MSNRTHSEDRVRFGWVNFTIWSFFTSLAQVMVPSSESTTAIPTGADTAFGDSEVNGEGGPRKPGLVRRAARS
jgi:hypothetical protein